MIVIPPAVDFFFITGGFMWIGMRRIGKLPDTRKNFLVAHGWLVVTVYVFFKSLYQVATNADQKLIPASEPIKQIER